MEGKLNKLSHSGAAKKRWEAPAILLEQSLVVRAQDPTDPTDPTNPSDIGRDPFFGPLAAPSGAT